jgi:hypothetical protein
VEKEKEKELLVNTKTEVKAGRLTEILQQLSINYGCWTILKKKTCILTIKKKILQQQPCCLSVFFAVPGAYGLISDSN